SIHSPQARGCHRLIKEGAKLVETAQDILEELRWAAPVTALPEDEASGASEADGNTEVLSLMGYDPCGLDELLTRSGLAADALSVILLHLELDGRVAGLPGGRYQRLRDR
ncbi:MAG: DNA-protecting protein DprA, partial [Candidatus Accumulibacter sp.]|nr:DNA-protecting protein DprA [Accumulibacter sp.]